MSKQPIPGVAPATLDEISVMTVWPSLAALAYGRWWGRRYASELGFCVLGIPVTLGRILALVSIPAILPVYFLMLIPRVPFVIFGIRNPVCRRYRLTNQRVVIETGLDKDIQRSVSLDRFDTIRVEVIDGQDWYDAGNLVFSLGSTETFRLEGVPRPETFRQTCLKSQRSYAGVEQAREMGVAV